MNKLYIIGLFSLLLFVKCTEDEDLVRYVQDEVEESADEIDIYFKEAFLEPYGTAVRWRWDDNLVANNQYVTPVKRKYCIVMGQFIKKYWIEPFEKTEAGKTFISELFPPEIVLIGSPMYNTDNTITLGYADAGVRISFTQINEYNIDDVDWILFQLRTAEHEFAHFVHQNYSLPDGFKELTPTTYQYTNWVNLGVDVQSSLPRISSEAISRGMVTNYGTASFQEDFCEIVSIYITSKQEDFAERYLPVDGEENDGKVKIAEKLVMIKSFYLEKFEIDLDQLRDEIIARVYGDENIPTE